jgi:GntR family transcriptional regulator / MocR family aminotransferase
MPVNAMEPMFELPITVPAKGSRDLLRALHAQLRAAILDGRLRPGLRMPPTRRFAAAFGISRNTAVAAYDLLLSEGYLTTHTGKGTFVAELHPSLGRPSIPLGPTVEDQRLAEFWRSAKVPTDAPAPTPCRYDFRPGYPDVGRFPFGVWQRLSNRAARTFYKLRAFENESAGLVALRSAIANHVSFARALACTSEDIVVTTGTMHAINLLARILVTPGQSDVVIEEPGYPPMRTAFAAAGARVLPVPVDEEGIEVDKLPESARVICVSPTHQVPLGVTMSAGRRAELLRFAEEFNAVVIESDYDGEFRIGGHPLDALRSIDRAGTVFYVGTFAKSVFPWLCIGFVVTPPWARTALISAKRNAETYSAALAQGTLAAFINEGHLARHVRKMRTIYRERYHVLRDALVMHCSNHLKPISISTGVHLAAEVTSRLTGPEVAARAAAAGIRLEPIDAYWHRTPGRAGVAFGFGLIETRDIAPAMRLLGRSLGRA